MKKITLTEILDYIHELPIKEKEELWEWVYNHTLVGGKIVESSEYPMVEDERGKIHLIL